MVGNHGSDTLKRAYWNVDTTLLVRPRVDQQLGLISSDHDVRQTEQSKVCLQYGTRNKVVSFTLDGLNDRARIGEAPNRAFGAELTSSNLDFQVYSKEFDEWIDLDGCDPVDDRSKLRIVCHISREVGHDNSKTIQNIVFMVAWFPFLHTVACSDCLSFGKGWFTKDTA